MSKEAFCYKQPVLENDLSCSSRSRIHTKKSFEMIKSHPELFTYLPLPPMEVEADFNRYFYEPVRTSPGECLYAITDKTSITSESQENYAGVISLSNTSPTNATTEMGVLIFPSFQRTHVTSNAIGLLLLYTLDPPSAGGLGLRRVEWKCNAKNEPSRRVAERMGFELEGIMRWDLVFEGGALDATLDVGRLERRNGTQGEVRGRHSAIFSIIWDEWDAKRAGVVVAQMKRKS